MEDMHMDKSGACAVLSAFKTIVEMKLNVIFKMKINISCTIALAENFLGDNAYRPSDIIKSRKGKINILMI